MTLSSHDETIQRAACAIAAADALLIGAGAGMGVDSGMPDFRGPEGFWKAYPAFKGRQFHEVSNPIWFRQDPELAWGFFGHRHNLYRDTQPHEGFTILRKMAAAMPRGAAVFTSNVDGHFQKASFSLRHIVECHGSIHHLQCSEVCSDAIWPAYGLHLEVDPETIRAASPLPTCRNCGAVARPNILMFNDYEWHAWRSDQQYSRLKTWLRDVPPEKLVVIEMGAGTAIPSVRLECEEPTEATLIRINPRDSHGPPGVLSLPVGALEGLQAIQAASHQIR